jgi:two-component sensor histidine kinase
MPQIQPVAPDREPQSKDRTTFSQIDRISRYLTREKRLRLVVNELGHRTKNLLAVVQAIATQTAQSSSDLNAFRSVPLRVLSTHRRALSFPGSSHS